MDWSTAFARQACSDFEARDRLLLNSDLPQCHQLHYLQMAMEKAAKAHLIAAGADPAALRGSHAYIAKVVPIIVRDALGRTPGGNSPWVVDAVRTLARRIELLAPSVDDGGAVPANCEYPWNEPDGIAVPAEHDFQIELHRERAAVTIIKEVRSRARELAGLEGETRG